MHTEKYLSFVYADEVEKQDSSYQYKTLHPRAHYVADLLALREELNHYFSKYFLDLENELTDKYAFLDYHLEKYTGHGLNFQDFLKRSPRRPFELNDHPGLEQVVWENRQEYINAWLQDRNEAIVNKKAKAPAYVPLPLDTRLVVKHGEKIYTAKEIEDWFTKELLLKTFNEDPIITPEDFKTFIHASFAAFEEAREVPANQKLVVNADGAYLKNMMFRFFRFVVPQDQKNKSLREGLALILKKHFSNFEKQEINTIYKSLGRAYTSRS